VASTKHSNRKYRYKYVNIPTPRNECRIRHNDNGQDHEKAVAHRVFELLSHLRDLCEKICELNFLACSIPGHVYLEQMAEKRLGNVHRYASEEDN